MSPASHRLSGPGGKRQVIMNFSWGHLRFLAGAPRLAARLGRAPMQPSADRAFRESNLINVTFKRRRLIYHVRQVVNGPFNYYRRLFTRGRPSYLRCVASRPVLCILDFLVRVAGGRRLETERSARVRTADSIKNDEMTTGTLTYDDWQD